MFKRSSVFQWTTIVVAITGVFLLDSRTPAGIEVWVLYLPVILSPVICKKPRRIAVVSATCSVLVVICFFVTAPVGNPPWWDLLNRGMGLMAIWLSAMRSVLLCNRSVQLATALASLQQETATREKAEQAAHEHEQRLHLAMKGAGMGTWDEDLRTGKVVWSETYFNLLGYEPVPSGEASREMWLRRVHAADRKRVLAAQEEARRERTFYCAEYRIHRPDRQEPVWLAVFGRFFYDGQGEAVRSVGVEFDVTRRKELESEVLRIAGQEQQEMGQELHDGIAQELTGLGMIAQTLAEYLPESAEENRLATRLVAGLDRVDKKVRELSRGLVAAI